MCVTLSLGDLNPDPYPSYLISTYTFKVTTASKVYGVKKNDRMIFLNLNPCTYCLFFFVLMAFLFLTKSCLLDISFIDKVVYLFQ